MAQVRYFIGYQEKTHEDTSIAEVDAAAQELSGAYASKTFMVTPWLDYWQGTVRWLPSTPLQEAMEKRWASSAWRQAALKLKSGSPPGTAKLLHIARPTVKVCHPHIVDGVEALNSTAYSEYNVFDDDSDIDPASAEYKIVNEEMEVRHGFIQCVLKAWNNHLPLVLKPDHVWVLILQGIALHVNSDPSGLRSRVLSRRSSSLDKKIDLGVDVDQLFPPECTDHGRDYSILVDEFKKLMEGHLSLVAKGAAATNFSTTSESDALVMKLTMMDMCEPYLNYWSDGACGFPAVTLAGNLHDWESLCDRAEEAISLLCHPEFAKRWIAALLPTLERFAAAYRGEVDATFWNAMIKRGGNLTNYYPRCGYSGWFHVFFPGDDEGAFSEWCVPYDGSMAYVKEGLQEPWSKRSSLSWAKGDFPDVRRCCEFPSGIAKVPIPATACSHLPNLEMHGGFVGYMQDDATGALMPLLSWYVVDTQTDRLSETVSNPVFGDNYSIAQLPEPVKEAHLYPEYWSGRNDTALQLVPIEEGGLKQALCACLEAENPQWLGQGREYRKQNNRGQPYNQLKLRIAWRVENAELWNKYQAELNKMERDLSQRQLEVFGSVKCGALRDQLPGQLQTQVGESFLLHGTSNTNLLDILRDGFNERLAQRHWYGPGNYFARDAGKADQYVDPVGEPWYDVNSALHKALYYDHGLWHPGDVHYVLLCRVAMGCAARSTDGKQNTLDGLPVWARKGTGAELRDLAQIPQSNPPLRYHSLMIETVPFDATKANARNMRGSLRYPEFIQTHAERCYPEYVLAVQRVWQ